MQRLASFQSLELSRSWVQIFLSILRIFHGDVVLFLHQTELDPSILALYSLYSRSASASIFRTISKARIKNPPEPLAGSHIALPSLGSTIRTINSTIVRGVKNWPISPLKVRPRKRSKATPFISSLVSERLYFSSNELFLDPLQALD